MSLATVTSPRSLTDRNTPRSTMNGGRVATLVRALRRRRHVAADHAREREAQTDAWVDRHGEVRLDVASLAAFVQR